MLLDGKLQETIDTEKLRLVRSDPEFIKAIEEYSQDPMKDLALTEAEKEQAEIPMYSLTEIYPDFREVFKSLQTKIIQIPLASLCGSVERLGDKYWHGFDLIVGDLQVNALAEKIKTGEFDSKTQPINVHAIPFKDKFEGFVQNGSQVVAAHKLAGKTSIWAQVTFYKEMKRHKNGRT